MQVQIIESNRGEKNALHDGHSYNQKQSTINSIHWRCTKYYKLKCPAILKTKNKTVIETKGTHNHERDPGECKAKEVVNQIKKEPNIQHQLWQLPLKYTKFRMIMQFSLQCPKKTTCSEQSLEDDKKRCVFKYLPQLIDILTSAMSLLPSSYKTVEKMIRREF